jgi:pyruvate, water dikinase
MSRLEIAKTGFKGLDKLFQNIRYGENIVWQITDIKDYKFFADRFVNQAISEGKNALYFHFGNSRELLEPREGLRTIEMDVNTGFEAFTVKAYNEIQKENPGTYYVFDCISNLQTVWAADFMMRNFYRAICSAIKEVKGVVYFSIWTGIHSYDSVKQIGDSASIFLNTLTGLKGTYVHPLRAVDRQSPTLFFPHLFQDGNHDVLVPIVDGISTSKYYDLLNRRTFQSGRRFVDNWEVFFMEAEQAKSKDKKTQQQFLNKAYKMLIGRDPERERLFKENFDLQDYININLRLIGSGSIGGKAAGMLLARKILEKNRPDLYEKLEPHDSYYIGSNVFYTFLIRNNWWKLWLEHKTEDGYFMAARALKSQIPYGEFPDLVNEKYKRMLDYYGQNPIIARSSSLLEDGFGNAFAGKYDSVFLVNGGTPETRYNQFIKAVKEVYASAMDESALVYRKQRGLDKSDEQMSILVQRVSGSIFDDIFLPGVAGVAYSENSYVWNKDIDPKAGMVRIVAGLGTRAVDRTLTDHPRIASLDKPQLTPSSSPQDKFKFVQRNLDVLDFSDNVLLTVPIEEIVAKAPKWFQDLIIEHDYAAEERFREMGMNEQVIATSCQQILNKEDLVTTMREILRTIHDQYQYPVDLEFTINFSEDGDFLINLVQCRPLQSKGEGTVKLAIPDIPLEQIIFKVFGNVMGGPIQKKFDLLCIIDPKGYAEMPYKEKFMVAKAVDAVNRYANVNKLSLMLMGPGRWGTTSPELGVPVNFAEISSVDAIFEMSFESSGLMPELSFGSHFFQDLVEADIYYGAIYENDCNEGRKSIFRPEKFGELHNIFDDIPEMPKSMADITKVYFSPSKGIVLVGDSGGQEAVCYLEKEIE